MSQPVPMWPKLSSVWDKRNARRQAKAWHSGKAKGRRNGKAKGRRNGRAKGRRNGKLAKVTVD